jgi:hypothetical protein
MNRNAKRILAMAASLLAVACGGGGSAISLDSGSGGDIPVPPPVAESPPFRFNARIGEERWSLLADETFAVGSRLLSYAQYSADLVRRFASSGSPAAVTANCAYAGTIKVQFFDRDGNGRASAGDTIVAVMDQCGLPVLDRTATGSVRIEITAAAAQGAAVEHQATLQIVGALQLEPMAGGDNHSANRGILRGSIGSQWSESETGMQLRAASSVADDLNFTATYDGIESVDRMRRIDVSQTVRYDQATSTGTMAFSYDVSTRGGTLAVRTPIALQGDLDVVPKQMQVDIETGGNNVIRLQRGNSPTGPVIDRTYGPDSGSPRDSNSTTWSFETLRFAHDGRSAREPVSYLDQGQGLMTVASWEDTATTSAIDRACDRPVAGVSFSRADALFQRPVTPPPALSEPGGLLLLQFGRAIADTTPALQFRFADTAPSTEGSPTGPTWSVATTSVRRGSSYEIRPDEPLRKGRRYALQASANGVDWEIPPTFLDANGVDVLGTTSAIDVISTGFTLIARTGFRDTGTVSPEAPARLSAEATLRDGQSVTGYQWQQVSGSPVTLSSPGSAGTDVVIGAGPRVIGDVVLQVTITDSLGRSDRTRVIVSTGNYVASGAALYTEQGRGTTFSRRATATGPGAILYGPDPGTVSPRVAGPSDFNTGIDFSVKPAQGARLLPGRFPNAVLPGGAGSQPQLMAKVYCNTLGSPVSGSFDVLEVDYSADGPPAPAPAPAARPD